MNIVWVDDGRVILHMNNTTHWNILWNTVALFPPQEMLPPEDLFCTLSCDNTSTANSEHLFGFAPCIPPLKEKSDSLLQEHDVIEIQSTDTFYGIHEDFSALFAAEEFASFI